MQSQLTLQSSATTATAASPPRPAQPRRLPQLDILRGVAILLVLFRHAVLFGDNRRASIWGPIVEPINNFGWTGVDLFFVLSGFLIGGLLFQEIAVHGRLDVRRFLTRRAFKIWPSYFCLIAVVMLHQHWAEHKRWSEILAGIWPNLLHVQNFFGSPRSFTWSLSVEEHFYLVLPLLLALLLSASGGRRPSMFPMLAVVLIGAAIALRFWSAPLHPWSLESIVYTQLRIDGLLFGVVLAYCYHFHHEPLEKFARHRMKLLLLGLALISPFFFVEQRSHFSVTIGFTLLYLGYGAILLAMVFTPLNEGIFGRLLASPACRLIAWVGVYSYSIYLWQEDFSRALVLHHLLHRLDRLPKVLVFPAVEAAHFILAIGAGAIMSSLIEWPSLKLRDRLFPAKAGAISNAPTPAPKPLEVFAEAQNGRADSPAG